MHKLFGKLTALGAALCLTGTLLPLAACGTPTVEVGDFASLISEENSGKNVKLTADIDCGGAEIVSISPKTFDGQGHTIKNAVIRASGYAKTGAGLFGRDTEAVSDLTVEGFEVHGTYTGAIVKYGGKCTLSNVHVKDSSLEVKDCMYAGAVWAGYTEVDSNIFGTGGSSTASASITGCSAENVTIEAASASSHSTFSYENMCVGGVAGTNIGTGASGCRATGCTINAVSNHSNIVPCVGGVFGSCQAVTKCYSENDRITGNASVWADKQLSSASDTTPKLYVGGVIGLHTYGKVSECYSSGDSLTVKSAGTAYAGGIAGGSGHKELSSANEEYLVECYAAGTSIAASNFAEEANDCEDERFLGGVVGYMKYGIVKSCFSCKVTVSDADYADARTEKYDTDLFRYGGFVGSSSHGTFKNCAAWGTSSIPAFDAFCEKVSSATDCYIYVPSDTDAAQNNASACKTLAETDWLGEGLKEKLALASSLWSFTEGELPSLGL